MHELDELSRGFGFVTSDSAQSTVQEFLEYIAECHGDQERFERQLKRDWPIDEATPTRISLIEEGDEMTQTHTPGPWYTTAHGESYQSTVSQEETGKTIAVTYTTNNADAHLIAAAPDLLEALETLSGAVDRALNQELDAGDCDCLATNSDITDGLNTSAAAIQKARGTSRKDDVQ